MANNEIEHENPLGQTIVLFVVFFVIFLAGIFAFSFLSLANVLPAAIALVLVFLAFFIPQTFLGRSDSSETH